MWEGGPRSRNDRLLFFQLELFQSSHTKWCGEKWETRIRRVGWGGDHLREAGPGNTQEATVGRWSWGQRAKEKASSWRKQRPAQTLEGGLSTASLESRKLAHLSKGFSPQNTEKGQEGWNFQELKLVIIIASTSRHCAKYFPSANSVHLANNATTTPLIRMRRLRSARS